MKEVLDKTFLDSLEGFPIEVNLHQLQFEPGNAYNPQVICEAKSKGQRAFGWFEPTERKAKINEQVKIM